MSKKEFDVEVEEPKSDVANAIVMMTQILQEMRSKHAGGSEIELLTKGVEALVKSEAGRPKENMYYPGISAMNPEGELKHPRAELKCKMTWVGHKLSKEALTHAEIDLLNKVQPGHYRVTKSDGSTIPFDVDAVIDREGRLERMAFRFPCKNTEDRHSHMPMTSYLREAMGELSPNVDRLMAQVIQLQSELACRDAEHA
mgnify:CR=1 FL=1